MPQTVAISPVRFRAWMRSLRDEEERQARLNPFLAAALENEKLEGHRFAIIARTVAFCLLGAVLPFLRFEPDILYYEVGFLILIALGWLQLRFARVGFSRAESAFLFLDLCLLTFLLIVPNPFLAEDLPTAFMYRLDGFVNFFIFLALGTLAYSWRTIWGIGIWIALLWLVGFLGIMWFGHIIPELSAAANEAFAGHEIIQAEMDPNSVRPRSRVLEIVVVLIVAAILTLKGWRSNQLLIRQANAAAERANLSRYFSSRMVDVLASSDRDIGAVRTQSVAVFFTDIVGFTKFAELHSPDKVMTLLRHYHAFVEHSVFQNKGTLDKYLGDGVMATFGTPETTPEDASNALKAALQLIEGTDAFNRDLEAKGIDPIEISVGIHFGPVILGDIGPSRRLEFAVVGDTVNVASRLEGATRELGCRCVVSDELMEQVRKSNGTEGTHAKFDEKEPIMLRGRQNAIGVWTA